MTVEELTDLIRAGEFRRVTTQRSLSNYVLTAHERHARLLRKRGVLRLGHLYDSKKRTVLFVYRQGSVISAALYPSIDPQNAALLLIYSLARDVSLSTATAWMEQFDQVLTVGLDPSHRYDTKTDLRLPIPFPTHAE